MKTQSTKTKSLYIQRPQLYYKNHYRTIKIILIKFNNQSIEILPIAMYSVNKDVSIYKPNHPAGFSKSDVVGVVGRIGIFCVY